MSNTPQKQAPKTQVPTKIKSGKVMCLFVTPFGVIRRWGKLRHTGILMVGKEEYMVKEEHRTFMQYGWPKKWYMAFFLDPQRKISLPPPGSDAKPWTEQEIEMAASVRARVYAEQKLREMEQALMRERKLMMLMMVLVMFGAIALIGFTNYQFAEAIRKGIQEAITSLAPPPAPPGP